MDEKTLRATLREIEEALRGLHMMAVDTRKEQRERYIDFAARHIRRLSYMLAQGTTEGVESQDDFPLQP